MPRLFIGNRDIQFINDIAKEFIKDVVGQKIYYYAISTMKTQVNSTYNEAVNKVFEKPIALDIIAGQPEWTSLQNRFGLEHTAKMEVFVQARDLIDKKINLSEGDYFQYGDAMFELVSFLNTTNIFGLEEYENSYKLVGQLARPGEFNANMFPPVKDEGDGQGTQTRFEQQRGLPNDKDGNPTGDVRQLRERLGDNMAPVALGEGPRVVDVGTKADELQRKNMNFYDE